MTTCANCGQSLPENVRFCTACGAPAGPAAGAGDDASTQVLPPGADEASTRVLPPGADQQPTEVLRPQGPAATVVMPAGAVPPSGGVAPPGTAPAAGWSSPPGPPPPTGQPPDFGASPSPSASHKKVWIIVAAVVVAVLVVLLALWLAGVFGGGEDHFVGTWWALDDSGGLVVQDDLDVWVVNDDGSQAGPMRGEVEDDVLTFELSDDALATLTGGDEALMLAFKGKITFNAEFVEDTGHLLVTPQITGDVGEFADQIDPTATEFKRVSSLPTSPPTPTASPTPSASPTATPSPSPTVTGSVSPSPTGSPTGSAFDDQRVEDGADEIAGAIEGYIADTGAAPPTGGVVPGGALESYLPAASWPENPYTEAPMTEGLGLGDYTYIGNADATFSLAAHLGDGNEYTLP